MAAPKTAEEKPQPTHNPWPPAPLPTPSELPEGTGHGHSNPIPWPKSGGPDDAHKPYKFPR